MKPLTPLLCCAALLQQPAAPPKIAREIALPSVAGRIDHLAFDVKRERVYVAALGNDTLELVDLAAGKALAPLTGHREPQGVALLAARDLLVVSDGGGEGCAVYDLTSMKVARRVAIGADCDNVRYDAAKELVWVAYGEGGLAAFDAATGERKATIALEGHPESFQLEAKGPRIFANVPGAAHVAVCDREQGKVLAKWPIGSARANFPMALDEAQQRLYVGCRTPARLLVLETREGKLAAEVELSGDVDDLFLDAPRKRLYAICGEGFVDVFDTGAATPTRVERIPTRSGARTGLLVPERSLLLVAARKSDDVPAALLAIPIAP